MKFIGDIFSGVGNAILSVGNWMLLSILRIGVAVRCVACVVLFGVGTIGVFVSDLPRQFVSFGMTLTMARIFGILCLLLVGFLFSQIMRNAAEIRARQALAGKEKMDRALKKANDELDSLRNDVAGKDTEIATCKKSMSEMEAKLFRRARTVDVTSMNDVLKLFFFEAEMTIYDFDNDMDMSKRPMKVEEFIGLGHHRLRSQWQYIGFREEKIKAAFGVDLNELHLEMKKDPHTGADILYVYGVRATHSVNEYTPMRQFSMLRKIYLQRCEKTADDPAYKQHLANMEVFETDDGNAWRVVKGRKDYEDYTCSREERQLVDAIGRQDQRMLDIHNGINRAQFKALDAQVIGRLKEYLKKALRPICDQIDVQICDDGSEEWNRIKALPRLQEFCENYNNDQMRLLLSAGR